MYPDSGLLQNQTVACPALQNRNTCNSQSDENVFPFKWIIIRLKSNLIYGDGEFMGIL